MEKEKLHKIKPEVFYYANNFKPKRKTVTRRPKEP